MGIRVTHGEPSTFTAIGKRIARYRKAEEKTAREEARANMLLQQQHQRQMQQFQAEIALRREQQRYLWDLQAEERARAWQIEKMEMSSRMDFQRQEQERARRLDLLNNKIFALEQEAESGRMDLNDRQYSGLMFKLKQEKQAVETGIEPERFGVAPWYMSPQHEETPEAQAALEKATGIKPKSARQQLTEIQAKEELGMYDEEHLRKLGLKPEDFPAVGNVEEAETEVPTPEELRLLGTREAYETGKRLGYWD